MRFLPICLLLAACASAAPEAPRRVVAEYADALLTRDLDRAYALMSAEYRARVSRAEFEERVERERAALQSAATRLRQGTVELRAQLPAPDGALRLVREGETWRLEEDPTVRYGQRQPTEALRSLVRALERKRFDHVFALLCENRRRQTTPEDLAAKLGGEHAADTALLAKQLRAHLADDLVLDGDASARLPYGPRSEARLKREAGQWCVDDPD